MFENEPSNDNNWAQWATSLSTKAQRLFLVPSIDLLDADFMNFIVSFYNHMQTLFHQCKSFAHRFKEASISKTTLSIAVAHPRVCFSEPTINPYWVEPSCENER